MDIKDPIRWPLFYCSAHKIQLILIPIRFTTGGILFKHVYKQFVARHYYLYIYFVLCVVFNKELTNISRKKNHFHVTCYVLHALNDVNLFTIENKISNGSFLKIENPLWCATYRLILSVSIQHFRKKRRLSLLRCIHYILFQYVLFFTQICLSLCKWFLL